MRVMLISVALLSLCWSASARAADFAIAVTWCGGGSPEISLRNVPKNTARLEAHMIDLMVPSYQHGGGKVEFKGENAIPCGALNAGFRGPSPPPHQIHDYEWTVKAYGADGAVLGAARTVKKFP
ncbi:hypothetical protein SAMN05519104_5671 [Rhizobiales bacterium GAS188]|nr:hypothetical protein SAMN05519104_5671 [Rhizobiales bacterium GAS188]